MAWTTPRTWVSGETVTATMMNAHVRDNLADLHPTAWTSYSPTWTGSGGNPSIGDGSLAGKYLKVGKVVFFEIGLSWGTTTNAGTGTWSFTLPTTSAASTGGSFPGIIVDFGTRRYLVVGHQANTTTVTVSHEDQAGAINGDVGAGVPHTWANGDTLTVSGYYFEA